jgi:hypothetical protein
MSPAVFEPAITGSEPRQNHALDGAVTGSNTNDFILFKIAQTDSVDYCTSYTSSTGVLLQRKYDQDIKLTTYVHIMPILRMRGAISESPNTSSCHGYGKLYLYVFFDYVFLNRWQFQLTN